MAGEFAGDRINSTLPEFSDDLTWASINGTEVPDVRLLGDFYRETDNVTRGVTLFPDIGEEADPFRDFDSESWFAPKGEAKQSGFVSNSDGLATDPAKDSNGSTQFTDLVQPAVADADRFHAATSVRFQAHSAAELAMSIEKFLSQTGEIIKVTPAKFSLKADIFQEINGSLLHCRIKVRIFRSKSDSEELMVDFCRRSGDAVAFQKIFSRTVQHVLAKFNAADDSEVYASRLGVEDVPPVNRVADPTELTLVPLLEMLQGDASPELAQAEAVAALAALASASTTSAVAVCAALEQLARPGVLEACAANCRTEVAYPAACLTKTLRDCGWVGA